MADDTTQDSTSGEPVSGQPEPEQQQKTPDVPPEVRKALRDANKEAETLRRRLKEFEDRDKTEAQKLAEERDALRAERDALHVASLRSQIALSKGVPADLVEFLTATDEDGLSEQADRLLARLAVTAPSVPQIDQGVRTTPLALNGDPLTRALEQKLGIR